MLETKPHHFVGSTTELDALLESVDESLGGFWLIYFKPSTKLSDITWDSIVETCLCNGWIDSLPGKVDDLRTKIYLSPRKVGSGWSRRNQLLVAKLEAAGRLKPAGVAVIERAKRDGSWSLFDLAEDLVVPQSLEALFQDDPKLGEGWKLHTESQMKQLLQRYYLAKTDAAKQRQIDLIRESIEQRLAARL